MAAFTIICMVGLDDAQRRTFFQGIRNRFAGGDLKLLGRNGFGENNAPALGYISADGGRNCPYIYGFALGEKPNGRPA